MTPDMTSASIEAKAIPTRIYSLRPTFRFLILFDMTFSLRCISSFSRFVFYSIRNSGRTLGLSPISPPRSGRRSWKFLISHRLFSLNLPIRDFSTCAWPASCSLAAALSSDVAELDWITVEI